MSLHHCHQEDSQVLSNQGTDPGLETESWRVKVWGGNRLCKDVAMRTAGSQRALSRNQERSADNIDSYCHESRDGNGAREKGRQQKTKQLLT